MMFFARNQNFLDYTYLIPKVSFVHGGLPVHDTTTIVNIAMLPAGVHWLVEQP
jgi:hypothetical protein